MTSDGSPFPPLDAPYAPDDGVMAARLLETAQLSAEQNARIDRTATRLIEAIRASDRGLGGVEDMLREFALSTKEGLALMVLAEALLRAISYITRPNPAHFWSMPRHGRSACRRAWFNPAKSRKERSDDWQSGWVCQRYARQPDRRCG
jgi:hypothetical protein